MNWRSSPSLSPEEAKRLHHDTLVVDTKYAATTSVPSQRVQEFFADQLSTFGQPGSLDRRTVEAQTKALAIKELWQSEDARRAYLEQWDKVGVDAGIVSVGVVQAGGDEAFHRCVAGVASEVLAPVLACRDAIQIALTASDIERAYESGKRALIIGCENSTPVSPDLNKLDVLYNMGMRYMQLTYNLRNLAGDGCTERGNGGLSLFGAELVSRLTEKRMIVDLSHANTKTALDALEISDQPMSISHASAKSVFNHDRATDDEVLKAVAERGGYIGVYVVPGFLQAGAEGTLDLWAEHVEYIARIAGIDAVGIGTDRGAVYAIPPELTSFETHYPPGFPWHGFTPEHRSSQTVMRDYRNVLDWPNLTMHLASRGFNEEELRKILGQNFLRFFRDVAG